MSSLWTFYEFWWSFITSLWWFLWFCFVFKCIFEWYLMPMFRGCSWINTGLQPHRYTMGSSPYFGHLWSRTLAMLRGKVRWWWWWWWRRRRFSIELGILPILDKPVLNKSVFVCVHIDTSYRYVCLYRFNIYMYIYMYIYILCLIE